MTDVPLLDAPVELRDLLPAEDLAELARSFADVHGLGIAVVDRRGEVAASAGLPAGVPVPVRGDDVRFAVHSLTHDGERLGSVVVGPRGVADDRRAEAIAAHLATVLEVLAHAGWVRHLTTVSHVAAMDAAFAEVTAKNQRLQRAVTRLEEVDRLKSSFLATMSHELRTPLTSVIGYSEMLLEGLTGALNSEQREYVQTILAKADQLLQIITSILDVSLLESGARTIDPMPVMIDELVTSVVSSFAPQAQKRRIELAVRRPDNGSVLPRVLGDSRKIRQVVWNLLSNAVKFTPDGGAVAVDITVGPLLHGGTARDRAGVRVIVSDSGIGIAPEKQVHIFEPFFQVDSSSTREYGGTGLGLTLAKSYAEAHGGQIWVDSAMGKGATFTVTFPGVPEEIACWTKVGRAGASE